MRRISVQEASEGMILAEPVIDPQGRVLMGQGERIDARLIDRFKNYGIAEIVIQAGADDGMDARRLAASADPGKAEAVEALRGTLDRRFRHHAGNAVMLQLRNLAEKQLLARIQAQS